MAAFTLGPIARLSPACGGPRYRAGSGAPELDSAGFGPRWHAHVLDGLLFAPVVFAMERISDAFPTATPWVMAAGTTLAFAYVTILTARYGRTLGKWVMGLEVVQVDGSPATWMAAALRHAPYYLVFLLAAAGGFEPGTGWLNQESIAVLPAFLLLLVLLVGELVTFIQSEEHRALHDLMAGTAVVHAEGSPRAR